MAGNTNYKNEWQKEHTDRIIQVVPKGQKEIIKEHAQAHGEKVNSFIKRAIDETMHNDKEKDRVAQVAEQEGMSTEYLEYLITVEEALRTLEKEVPSIRKLYLAEKDRQERPQNSPHITTLSPA